jgi:O-antigen/teichoic acid export membrane protein
MSQVVISRSSSDRAEIKIDSIASGLSFMLIANTAQRAIGFIRNLAFCYFLSEQHLGMWALASSFFILAAPFAVLGLPGSLGRFVEFYRVRSQLMAFVKRVAIVSTLGSIGVCAGLILFAPWTSSLILGEQCGYGTMTLLSGTLATVTAFNFLNEMVCGLRQPRMASSMQMVNSMSFTVLSLLWFMVSDDWRGVVVAFALASVLGMVPAWIGLKSRCGEAFAGQEPLVARAMWQKIIPFAAAMWTMNLLTNLFDIVDRYMILHCAAPTVEQGQAIVGQYHSGRILPVLLTSLGLMLNGMLLPYLSADWEAGLKDRVMRTLRSGYIAISLFFWALSIGGMLVAPFLFESLLAGRYAEGLELMPAAMLYCSVSVMTMNLQNYFWCVDRGRVIGFVTLLGLLLNLGLNYWLVPLHGAWGAMFATLIAGGVVLMLTVLRLRAEGIKIGRRSLAISCLPLTLLVSTWLSLVCFCLLAIAILRTERVLSKFDKDLLMEHLKPLGKKLGIA